MTSAVPGGAHAPLGPEQCDRCAPRRTAAAGQHAAHVVLQLLNREAPRRTHTAGANYFAGRTHLGATVAALIAHHDREQPDAPAAGPDRVMSVLEHTSSIATDVRAQPGRYRDAVAGMHAHYTGGIDHTLLRHAVAALLELPRLATVGMPAHRAD